MLQWVHTLEWIKDFWYVWLLGAWALGRLWEMREVNRVIRTMVGRNKLFEFKRMIIGPFVILSLISILWWLMEWLFGWGGGIFGWIQAWSWQSLSAWSFSAWYDTLSVMGMIWFYYGCSALGLICLALMIEMLAMNTDGASGFALFAALGLSVVGLQIILLLAALEWLVSLFSG